ncbi:MAG: tetratricopeptide repeat protein [Roseiflexaceae bacterium]|nr:tetratricopeptide repeat protein [Roseiflexaceae bacterium]
MGRLQPQEAIDYGIQICRGMQHAVDRLNLVHRDLKPDNIMISFDGRARVTDFGLAKVLRPWQASFGVEHAEQRNRVSLRAAFSTSGLGGTLPYMAPELFDGAAASIWSDIYAFGVTLYEMLVGRLPFDAQRDDALIRLIRTAPPPDPRRPAPHVPPDAAEIVMRCLAKRPAERFQSFVELEAALQHVREALVGSPFVDESPFDNRDEAERWKERGLMHMNMGEYKEAIRCFRRAVELDQDQPDSWNLIARCSLKLWLYHEALQAVDEGLRRAVSRTEFAHLYGARGDIFATMQKPVEALAAYDTALSYTPSAPSLWRSKGVLLQRLGEIAQAQECLEKAIHLDSSDAVAHRHLGDLLCSRGRYKAAVNSYAKSLKLDPRSADGWVKYGSCLLRLARTEEAQHAFEKALQIDPENSDALAGLRQIKK